MCDRQVSGVARTRVAELHQWVGQPDFLPGLDLLELCYGDLESASCFGLFLFIFGLGPVQGDGGRDDGIPGSLERLLRVAAVRMGIVDKQDRPGTGSEGVADL